MRHSGVNENKTDFWNSSLGSDLLKLTREDVVQICGPADGIRLFNALKSRCVCVRICVFLRVHADIILKVSCLFVQISASQIDGLRLSGEPRG